VNDPLAAMDSKFIWLELQERWIRLFSAIPSFSFTLETVSIPELQAMLEKSELQPVYSFPAPATSPLHRDDSRVDFFSCKSLKAVSSNILNSCSSFHGSGPVSWDTNEDSGDVLSRTATLEKLPSLRVEVESGCSPRHRCFKGEASLRRLAAVPCNALELSEIPFMDSPKKFSPAVAATDFNGYTGENIPKSKFLSYATSTPKAQPSGQGTLKALSTSGESSTLMAKPSDGVPSSKVQAPTAAQTTPKPQLPYGESTATALPYCISSEPSTPKFLLPSGRDTPKARLSEDSISPSVSSVSNLPPISPSLRACTALPPVSCTISIYASNDTSHNCTEQVSSTEKRLISSPDEIPNSGKPTTSYSSHPSRSERFSQTMKLADQYTKAFLVSPTRSPVSPSKKNANLTRQAFNLSPIKLPGNESESSAVQNCRSRATTPFSPKNPLTSSKIRLRKLDEIRKDSDVSFPPLTPQSSTPAAGSSIQSPL
jgi:hypothetical protein